MYTYSDGTRRGLFIQNIISSLRSDDEPQQLSALTELCDFLSISSEATLTSFPIETVVPLLVRTYAICSYFGYSKRAR